MCVCEGVYVRVRLCVSVSKYERVNERERDTQALKVK